MSPSLSVLPLYKRAVLGFLYASLTLASLHAIWPLLPEPEIVYIPLGGLLGAAVTALTGLKRPAQPVSALEWTLLLNGLALWLVLALQMQQVGGHVH